MRYEIKFGKINIFALQDEIAVLANIFAEASHGYQRHDLHVTPSAEQARLLSHISDVYEASVEDREIRLRLDFEQVDLLVAAIRAALNEFANPSSEDEFYARTGGSFAEVKSFLVCVEDSQAALASETKPPPSSG